MPEMKHEIAYRKLDQQNGILIPQGIWLFNSPEEWVEAGKGFEQAGHLMVVPFIDPPKPPQVDWKRESVIVVAGGDSFDSPRGVVVTSVLCHGNKALVKVDLQPMPGTGFPCLSCEVGAISEKHLKDIEVEWRIV